MKSRSGVLPEENPPEVVQCNHCLKDFKTRRGFAGHCKKCSRATLYMQCPDCPRGVSFRVLPGENAREVYRQHRADHHDAERNVKNSATVRQAQQNIRHFLKRATEQMKAGNEFSARDNLASAHHEWSSCFERLDDATNHRWARWIEPVQKLICKGEDFDINNPHKRHRAGKRRVGKKVRG
jgi:hypothetical protein